jgi:hypothetical protein
MACLRVLLCISVWRLVRFDDNRAVSSMSSADVTAQPGPARYPGLHAASLVDRVVVRLPLLPPLIEVCGSPGRDTPPVREDRLRYEARVLRGR